MLSVGCTTPAIEARHHYTEKVSSILISQDKQKLVFIGEPYHYIFDAPAGIVNTLQLPFHSKVSGNLSDFHVDNQDGVTGLYSLVIAGNLQGQDQLDAVAAGFKPDASGKLTLSGKIAGRRYQEDTSLYGKFHPVRNQKEKTDEATGSAESLNKTYSIIVTYDPSNGEKAADTLISPIVVSSEGLYLLFNVFLAPVVIPIAVSNVRPECFPYCITQAK